MDIQPLSLPKHYLVSLPKLKPLKQHVVVKTPAPQMDKQARD